MKRLPRSLWLPLLAAWLFSSLVGCGGAAQLGPSEEAFGEVDALYTAVTTKRKDLLADCKARLIKLKEGGELPAPAMSELEPIIAQAEKEEWRPAAERLYTFMRDQRKEAAH